MRFIITSLIVLLACVNAPLLAQGNGEPNMETDSYKQYQKGWKFYNNNNYGKALYYIEKIKIDNSVNDSAMLLAYLAADKLKLEQDKLYLLKTMKPKLARNLPSANNKTYQYFYMESGSRLSTVDTIGNINFLHIAIRQKLGNAFSLYHGYSLITQSNYWGNITQNQYYASLNYKPKLLLDINAGFHYINANVRYTSDQTNDNRNNIVVFAMVNKKMGVFDVFTHLSSSYLNNANQIQLGGGLAYLPFGNNNLVLASQANMHLQNSETNILHKHAVAFKIPRLSEKFTYKAQYFYANVTNYTDRNAYIVNNAPDKTIDQLSASAYWEINPKATVHTTFLRERREEAYYKYPFSMNMVFVGLIINLSKLGSN